MDLGTRESLWMDTAQPPPRSAPEEGGRYDVAVVGAGITGLTTAALLVAEGRRVAVLEMGRIGQGVTGYTTAKVTSLHELVYATLQGDHGEEAARTYGMANEAGIATIARLVDTHGIDCDLERRPAVTWTADESMVGKVREEAQVATHLGLPARFTTDVDVPVDVLAAVVFDDQAQLHPRRYLMGLADAVEAGGGAVFEHARVVDVRDGAPAHVRTTAGVVIEADDVVIATHLPMTDRGAFFAKAHPKRSYGMAVRVRGPVPQSMSISAESPTRSVRPLSAAEPRVLILSGDSHKPGADDDEGRHWRHLADWAQAHFDVEAFTHRWSAQDYVGVDGLPYVGKVARTATALWTATGYRKWGMTNGTAAAMVLTDLISERENPWAATLDANRVTPTTSVTGFVQENLEVARHFVADRVGLPGREAVDDLAVGEGAVIRVDGEAYAVSRDDDGSLRTCSPVCTHLGCHVAWNTAERSWDCPCHGSRFAADGTVVQGPAVRDLDAKRLPD